nr:MAG TPA: tail protein [Caudoviricetes sp.]
MLESLKYKNHLGEVIDFGQNGIYVSSSDLHNYEWEIVTKGTRIASLRRNMVTRNLPVIIYGATEADSVAAKNRLMEICEKDCVTMQPGRIICNGYYYTCYVTQSQKKNYLENKRYMRADLTIAAENPQWIKESLVSFAPSSGAAASGLDYSYDYPFDYTPDVANAQLVNPAFADANFRLIIYGAVTNPTVTIGGHVYQVNCAVAAGEYLTIDSLAKDIILTGSKGATTNKFNDRNRDSYIFEKIPAGANAVAWSGDFGFDITIYEERPEPKWT